MAALSHLRRITLSTSVRILIKNVVHFYNPHFNAQGGIFIGAISTKSSGINVYFSYRLRLKFYGL